MKTTGGRLHRVNVISNQAVRPGAWVLTLERTGSFVPGQCVGVTTDATLPPRSYSLSSGATDPRFEILYDVFPKGELTPRLARLVAGDQLLVTEPFGSFVDRPGPAVWIATGTGVAPFVSMARTTGGAGRTLVQGSRAPDGLYYRELFESCGLEAYIPCCSRVQGVGTFAGRVTAWLQSATLDPASRYYLCGGAEMVVDTRDLLIARGVPYTGIVAEVYF